MASFTEEPVNASNETFKVLVIDYYATGEGRHVLIKTGTEGLVKEGIGDWLYQGADVYTVEQWLNIDKIPHSRSYQNSNIETLKSFAPVLWGAMNEGVSMFVDIEYHWSRG
ncbi:hypothetical protein FCV43_04175 [Vibrio genomosp. F6]|nr:hypothetical protein FCV43_04175 [Vibrio genomosp. F6]